MAMRWDDLLDKELEVLFGLRRPSRRRAPDRIRTQLAKPPLADLVEVDDALALGGEADFDPTFSASKHERGWILDYLGRFYEDKLITDVLRSVKGGKEANVYCCEAHPSTGLELIAAKVYRPRMFRQLRNDARYRQGRDILDEDGHVVHDGGMVHAVRKKSSFGRELAHSSWLAHEYQTLTLLYEAGADVPRPLEQGNNTILMEYLGLESSPAPTLHQVRLPPGQVRPIYHRLMENVELMLTWGRVHGDLSAFNVLYWEGDVWIIDFPQAIDPWDNPDAWDIFQRDIRRLCQYFGRYGLPCDPARIAGELWARHGPEPMALCFPEDAWLDDDGESDAGQ